MFGHISDRCMKKLIITFSVVLALTIPIVFLAQGQPSIQRFNYSSNLSESGQSPLVTNENVRRPLTSSLEATVFGGGRAILDITGIQINDTGNVTFFLKTPDWVSVRNQPSILYLPIREDANGLARKKMFDLLFYAFTNKQDVSIGYNPASKIIQVVNV